MPWKTHIWCRPCLLRLHCPSSCPPPWCLATAPAETSQLASQPKDAEGTLALAEFVLFTHYYTQRTRKNQRLHRKGNSCKKAISSIRMSPIKQKRKNLCFKLCCHLHQWCYSQLHRASYITRGKTSDSGYAAICTSEILANCTGVTLHLFIQQFQSLPFKNCKCLFFATHGI